MSGFFSLTPDATLDAVEAALNGIQRGVRATGRVFALNSVENRVYQIELEDESFVIAKFYRPQRWTTAQILEEHEFTRRLKEAEIPVAAPLLLEGDGKIRLHAGKGAATLAETNDGILFAVFERLRGRIRDELAPPELRQLGRFLGRLHAVGASFPFQHRKKLDVATYASEPLAFLLGTEFLQEPFRTRYSATVQSLVQQITPQLASVKMHAIHGDCHLGNVLWDSTGPFFVDFDDTLSGPPSQDVWMILKGRDEEAAKARDELLSGYEEIRDFDHASLRLIEPLRALRLIHYSAWIARRWEDPSFPKMFPDFGSQKYWQSEIEALSEILDLIARGH